MSNEILVKRPETVPFFGDKPHDTLFLLAELWFKINMSYKAKIKIKQDDAVIERYSATSSSITLICHIPGCYRIQTCRKCKSEDNLL